MPRYVELTGTVLSTLLSNLQIQLGQVTFFWLGLKALWEEFSEYWQGGLSGRGVCLGHKSDRFLKGVKGKPDLCLFGRVTDHDGVGSEVEGREMQVETSEGFFEAVRSHDVTVTVTVFSSGGDSCGGGRRPRSGPESLGPAQQLLAGGPVALPLLLAVLGSLAAVFGGDMECQGVLSKI